MSTQDVVFTQPGTWTLSCRVADHVAAGMIALYDVTPAQGPLALPGAGKNRTFYIAAGGCSFFLIKLIWDTWVVVVLRSLQQAAQNRHIKTSVQLSQGYFL
jgi:hypothetical protein